MERRSWITGTITSIVIWLGINGNVMSIPDITLVWSECHGTNDPSNDYQQAVDTALRKVACGTDQRGYDYYTWGRHENAIAYARGECSYRLTSLDCKICLRVAIRRLRNLCATPVRAYIQFADCQLKFQDRPFSSIAYLDRHTSKETGICKTSRIYSKEWIHDNAFLFLARDDCCMKLLG